MTAGAKLLTITGAAGRIGSFYRRHFGRRDGWELRLQDVREIPEADARQTQIGNLADLEVARRAVAGAHTVLHLAADPSPSADFHASLLERNIVATYNVFHAAAEAGVRRLIFASSINAVNAYPTSVQVHADKLARPGNVYGATKVWGEALASSFVAQKKIPSVIAVRIAGVTKREAITRDRHPHWLSFAVTEEDLCRLFDCCLDADPAIDFAVVHGESANRFLRMELESTRKLIGYEPKDDAFAIAESRE